MRPKNIALFPVHRPGEKFLRCQPAAKEKILLRELFFTSLFNYEKSLCMYQGYMHYDISCFISHVSFQKSNFVLLRLTETCIKKK